MSRSLARRSAVLVAAIALATTTTTAHAQPPEPNGANVTATAKITGGPYVLGQRITFELTITNIGDAEAVGVAAWDEHISGSLLDLHQWDGLKPEPDPAMKIAPHSSKTFRIWGVAYEYAGNAKLRVRVNATNDVDPDDGSAEVEVPILEPKNVGKVAGVLWGDANGNGVQDAGEGLNFARVTIASGLEQRHVRTDVNGRFVFTDVKLAEWRIRFGELPRGWVLRDYEDRFPVNGSDSTSDLRYQAVRPLSDRLSASMRFVSVDVSARKATVEFTLTNSGSTDITGVVADCYRAPKEPAIDVRAGLGELGGPNGVTVRAGESRVFTVPGSISVYTERYGYADVRCTFGPAGGIVEGFPGVHDFVRTDDRRNGLRGALWLDRNDNYYPDDGEHLIGVSISLVDPHTGQVLGTATTGADRYAYFTDIPAGLYHLKINGPYRWKDAGYYSPGSWAKVEPAFGTA